MNTRLNNLRPFFVLAVVSILISGIAPSAMAELKDIDVHGFAGQGYMGSTDFNYLTPSIKGSWAMSEYAINVGSDLNDQLRVGVQFFGRNLGDLGNNEVGVDWAFGDYRPKDWFGVRGGRVKLPWGLYNETADFDHVRTSVLLPQGVYDLRLRDFRTAVNGINPYGSVNLDAGGSIDYAAVAGYTSYPREGAIAKFFDSTGMFKYVSMNNRYTLCGQLLWNTPLQGLRIGHTLGNYRSSMVLEIDAMTAMFLGIPQEQDFEVKNLNINTSSAEYSYGNFLFAGEYNTWESKFEHDLFGFELHWENWYALGSYRVNRWFEFGSYYSEHYEDKNDRKGENFDPNFKGWQKDLALSLRFDVTPNMIFKLEGHRMDGYASCLMQENLHLGDPSEIEQNWYMFASKLSFAF